jgi:hypothetical protein
MHRISVAGLAVNVVRKDIKNLHLGVYPPNGRIRVAAPQSMDDEAVRLAVSTKLAWIKRQQKRFKDQERQPPRQYVYRESHYYFGQRYLLHVIEEDGPARIMIRNKTTLDLHIPKGTDITKRGQIMHAWYRKELKARIPDLIEKWEPIIGVNVTFWGIKKMKTKWGSCNSRAGRIWLNLELAKKPVQCLEFIVVHEMVHMLERHHNDDFKDIMDHLISQWRFYRDELNRAPLGHETWSY